jgi:hypothetical protein
MNEVHKVVVGRVYYINADNAFDAMERAIERDKRVGIDVDALQIGVTVNPEGD